MSEQELKQHGYADGDYHCYCQKCGGRFIGDKRAVTCKSCATQINTHTDTQDVEQLRNELEEIKLAAIESLKNTGGTGKGKLWEIIYGNNK